MRAFAMAGAVGLAVVAAASPASSTGLRIAPVKQAASPGSHAVAFVENSGRVPLRVGIKLAVAERVAGHCKLVSGQPSWASVNGPSAIRLRPKQMTAEHISVGNAPAGKRDLVVLFTALPNKTGQVGVSVSLASQIIVTGHGSAPNHLPPPCATLASPAPGLNAAFIYGPAAALVAVAGLVVAFVLRRRRRRAV